MARNRLTEKIAQIQNLVKRLEEDKRLDTSSKETTYKLIDIENH